MELSPKEIKLIKAAVKSRNQNKIVQSLLFAALIGALMAMLYGEILDVQFAYIAIPLVLINLALPQLGTSPKYNELLDILEKQLPQKQTKQTFEEAVTEVLQANQNKNR